MYVPVLYGASVNYSGTSSCNEHMHQPYTVYAEILTVILIWRIGGSLFNRQIKIHYNLFIY